MDERAIKRLLVTLAVAIAIIMVAKFMLTKAYTYTRLNKAAAEKKLAAARQVASPPAVSPPPVALPEAAPAIAEPVTVPAASAVAGTVQ